MSARGNLIMTEARKEKAAQSETERAAHDKFEARARARRIRIALWQWALLLFVFVFWWAMTKPGLLPNFFFDNDAQAAFFFGEPLEIFARIRDWFVGGEIYRHLGVTLYETVLAFVIGTVAGLAVGLWLALSPFAAAVADPFIKGFNSMPRVILAPIFAVWFGLGPASKVAHADTVDYFNVN